MSNQDAALLLTIADDLPPTTTVMGEITRLAEVGIIVKGLLARIGLSATELADVETHIMASLGRRAA